MSCCYYISCSFCSNKVELRLFCDDPDHDDETIDVAYEFQSGKDNRISDMSLCVNAGQNVPDNYKNAIQIIDEVLIILECSMDLSDFNEMIENKFFNDEA